MTIASPMSHAKPLLVELLVEELPPKSLKSFGTAFASKLVESLREQGLLAVAIAGAPARGLHGVTSFATPRRLGVLVPSVLTQAPERAASHKLMPASVGLDAQGQPTAALVKKLASLGADAARAGDLRRALDGKAEMLFFDTTVQGTTLPFGLEIALQRALALPVLKNMQYQLADGWTSVSFVRPAHGLVALHGSDVVKVSALGLAAGRTTLGHRFEATTTPVTLRDAESYAEQLRDDGAVIASFDERRAEIVRQLGHAASAAGLTPIDDDALLDEVTALVERPNVLTCRFEAAFLAVPPEVLILTMKANQKYFPLLDAKGALTDRFLVVSNVSPADASRIVEGNERVVRPRLADAKFFFDQDRRATLASRVGALDRVVYHAQLGTQGARVGRMRQIARWVAERIGADVAEADRAAELAKADLTTQMVGEFPELQGVMGGYYATHDGEPAAVARAIAGQYVNRRGDEGRDAAGAGDDIGASLLLADRVETLVGIWGVGLKPTGERDPYALRRHALTLIHTFGGLKTHALSLHGLLQFTLDTFGGIALQADTLDEVETFVYERAANQLAASFDARAVDAVIALRPPLQELAKRLAAVRDFQKLDAATALAAANKRVGNILRKSVHVPAAAVSNELLSEPAEHALHRALRDSGVRADAHFDAGDFTASLTQLAALREPVDAFFDTVMVNADDPALRANRLALLAALQSAMNRVADLSRLAG